jgi:hypothetical protein
MRQVDREYAMRQREIYASADFATSFLEAAIRKAGIQLTVSPQDVQSSSWVSGLDVEKMDDNCW